MVVPDLDELIAEVDRACPSTDWISRLRTAAELAGRLQALGDDLVTDYVEHARFRSISWSEIGEALGVSRQAVQQRFLVPHREYLPEEFSEELQVVMPAIKKVAIAHRHNYIATEHVLLGILSQPNTATRLLDDHGIDVDALCSEIDAQLGLGASQAAGRIAWTPYARRVTALAKDAAQARQHDNAIRCADMLTGLVNLRRGQAARALASAGFPTTRKTNR